MDIMNDNIIAPNDEFGSEVRFEFLDLAEYEDEDILMAVFQIFKNKFKDKFDFEE